MARNTTEMLKQGASAPEAETPVSKGERTRRRIVGYATMIIYDKGYGKTTIEDVIEAAGVTKGSFYFHFSSKEELGYAVIENASSHILGRIKQVLENSDQTSLLRIETVLEEIRGIVESADCSRGCILGNLALEMSRTNEGFRDRIARAFKDLSSLLAPELEDMKSRGELPPDFNCAAYADFAVSSLEGAIMMSKLTLDPAPMRNGIVLIMKQFEALREVKA